mgnify:CR=1 FL=1|tara:strand:- start:194 stop:394 length:201 start_codon:yes stop_codon:yes gene_type:complete
MLNTFFFGYLPLKWKRLARVLSFLTFPITEIINQELNTGIGGFGLAVHPLIIAIISYTIKPFVVKD